MLPVFWTCLVLAGARCLELSFHLKSDCNLSSQLWSIYNPWGFFSMLLVGGVSGGREGEQHSVERDFLCTSWWWWWWYWVKRGEGGGLWKQHAMEFVLCWESLSVFSSYPGRCEWLPQNPRGGNGYKIAVVPTNPVPRPTSNLGMSPPQNQGELSYRRLTTCCQVPVSFIPSL